MTTFDADTLDFYAAEAPVYTASGCNGVARHLPGFLDKLIPNATILELGCGGGRDAAYMIERGFAVEATDGSAAMATQAAARLGTPVHVMRFDELDALETYDAIVASASLLHVPRKGLPDVLARIWRALKPGGWHVATFKGGNAEGRDKMGRYFNYLSPDVLEENYRQSGNWSVLEIEKYVGGGYDGKQGPWLKIVVHKSAEKTA